MSLFTRLKAAFIFARYQAWADAAQWEKDDATNLTAFLVSPTGSRFRAILRNTNLTQQAQAITKTDNLAFEAGYCNGQKGLITTITALADESQFSEQGDTDADPVTTPAAS